MPTQKKYIRQWLMDEIASGHGYQSGVSRLLVQTLKGPVLYIVWEPDSEWSWFEPMVTV